MNGITNGFYRIKFLIHELLMEDWETTPDWSKETSPPQYVEFSEYELDVMKLRGESPESDDRLVISKFLKEKYGKSSIILYDQSFEKTQLNLPFVNVFPELYWKCQAKVEQKTINIAIRVGSPSKNY